MSRSTKAALLAVILSIIPGVFLGFYPCSLKSETQRLSFPSDGGVVSEAASCSSLIESQGIAIAGALAIPLVLSLASVAAAWLGLRALLWVMTGLALLFAVLTGFSIGLFYFPCAVALGVSAATIRKLHS